MFNVDIIKEILIFIAGVAATASTFFLSRKKNRLSEIEMVIKSLSEQLANSHKRIDLLDEESRTIRDNYEQELKELRKEIEELKKQLSIEKQITDRLRSDLVFLESAHFEMPFPQWLKSLTGTMIKVNRQYEHVFLRPMNKDAEDYIGKKDVDIWGEEMANQFAKNDDLAKDSRLGYWIGKENINGTEYQIVKYKLYAGSVCIGIAGLALPITN